MAFLDLTGLSWFLVRLHNTFATKQDLKDNYLSKEDLGDVSVEDLKGLLDDVAYLKKHAVQDSND